MAGTELVRLQHPLQVALGCECRPDLVAAVAVHDVDCSRLQRARCVDHVRQHRLACDFLQHLGQRRFHPLALASGENHDMQGRGHGYSDDGSLAILTVAAATMRSRTYAVTPAHSMIRASTICNEQDLP